MTAEPEAVAERHVDLGWTCFVRNVVEVAARILILVVDRRWGDVVLDRENRDGCLDSSGGAEAVTVMSAEPLDVPFGQVLESWRAVMVYVVVAVGVTVRRRGVLVTGD